MSISVVSASDIAKAVQQQLDSHALVGQAGVKVERSERLNSNSSVCPWVGVYISRVQYPVRALTNYGQSRYQEVDLILVCQEASLSSGAECSEKVERLVANVMVALFDNQQLRPNGDPTQAALVDQFDNIEVHYQSYTKADAVFMQTVNLYVTTRGRTN